MFIFITHLNIASQTTLQTGLPTLRSITPDILQIGLPTLRSIPPDILLTFSHRKTITPNVFLFCAVKIYRSGCLSDDWTYGTGAPGWRGTSLIADTSVFWPLPSAHGGRVVPSAFVDFTCPPHGGTFYAGTIHVGMRRPGPGREVTVPAPLPAQARPTGHACCLDPLVRAVTVLPVLYLCKNIWINKSFMFQAH